jgi:hypothetical protein
MQVVQGRVARFFLVLHTKTGKIYTALPQNIPNGRKIYKNGCKIDQMSSNIPTSSIARILIFTQSGIFG